MFAECLGSSLEQLLFVAVINMAKTNSGNFYLSLRVTVHHLGKPGRKLKAGTWRQELKHRSWNALYWLARLLLLQYGLPA